MQSASATIPPRRGRRLGLLAGSGEFPVAFAEAARQAGHRVYCLGVLGMASQSLREVCDGFKTVPLAQVGRAIRLFKRAKIRRIVMAGKIEKKVLFHPFRALRLMPDWRAIHLWFRYTCNDKRDDTLLRAVIREFERDRMRFESALGYCPELIVNHGFLTRKKPSTGQWRDIRFGWELAKEIGRLDIGQTVIVKDTAVIAVEAIEGTDAAIRRAGDLCRRGGFCVVKVAKPQQDMRFDVPTIGIRTIQSMHEAGGRVLAVESGVTIVLDQPAVIELANKLGITVVSLNAEELRLGLLAS